MRLARPSVLFALVLIAAVLPTSSQAGPFDYWVVSFVWSPQYCKDAIASKEPQCREEHYFVVNGLQSHVSGPDPECKPGDMPPKDLVERMLPIMYNAAAVKAAWKKGGACSAMSQNEYFLQLDRAGRRVDMPSAYNQPTKEDITFTAAEFKAAFAAVNEGMTPAGVLLVCRSKYVKEVHVCLDSKFDFRDCAIDQKDEDCDRSELKLRKISGRLVPERP